MILVYTFGSDFECVLSPKDISWLSFRVWLRLAEHLYKFFRTYNFL